MPARLSWGGAYPLGSEITLALLFPAFFLVVSLAAFTGAAKRNAQFWLFNHNLWLGAAMGIFAGVLFFAGAASILASLKYLFGLPINDKLWADFGAIAVGIVGPVTWLGLVPRRHDQAVVEGHQTEFTSYAVAALVKFILVPLLLVYAVILHAYALKIGITRTLPKGQLGWMVLSYGCVITGTALLTFPTRDSGGALNRLFWRYWPWLLLVPTILLFIAVATRIGQYGLSEKRYLVLLAGLWFVILTIAFGIFKKHLDLRLIPGSLAVLLLAASLGSWGVSGLSSRAQLGEFKSLLDRVGITKDGALGGRENITVRVLADNSRRANSIIHYLQQSRHLDLLAPMFSGSLNDPFPANNVTGDSIDRHARDVHASRFNWYSGERQYRVDRDLAKRIRFRLRITGTRGGWHARRNFLADREKAVLLDGIGWIIPAVSLTHHQGKRSNVRIDVGREAYDIQFDGRSVVILQEGSRAKARFDIADNRSLEAATLETKKRKKAPIGIVRQSGDLNVKLVVFEFNTSRVVGGNIDWTSLTAFLVFPTPLVTLQP